MQGKCLCGAVRLATASREHVHACHCGMCRRWGGGPFLAIHCWTEVTFEGESNVTRYASSDWAERGFCQRCGTHLFYRVKPAGDYYVPAGVFDDAPDLTFVSQIFIDKKPSYYAFANATANLTEQEFLKKFSA